MEFYVVLMVLPLQVSALIVLRRTTFSTRVVSKIIIGSSSCLIRRNLKLFVFNAKEFKVLIIDSLHDSPSYREHIQVMAWF